MQSALNYISNSLLQDFYVDDKYNEEKIKTNCDQYDDHNVNKKLKQLKVPIHKDELYR